MKNPYISPVEKRFGDIAEHILIGRMAQHWTLLHFNIYAMFLGFTDLHREVATAIFFTLKADSAQREITLAAALARLELIDDPSLDDLKQKIREFFKAVGKFAGTRNAAVHAMITVSSHGEIVRNPFAKPNSPAFDIHSKLKGKVRTCYKLHLQSAELHNECSQRLDWRQSILPLPKNLAPTTPPQGGAVPLPTIGGEV